jgi:hypothetical protein
MPGLMCENQGELKASVHLAGNLSKPYVLSRLSFATSCYWSSVKSDIRPFHVSFPEDQLTDLRRRIKATKWSEKRNA